jgi:hypothetical protein
MAWVSQGVPKVSPGPAMPNPATPCRQNTPETALWPFQGWPARWSGGLQPSSTALETPRRTPMVEGSVIEARCWQLSVAFQVFLEADATIWAPTLTRYVSWAEEGHLEGVKHEVPGHVTISIQEGDEEIS